MKIYITENNGIFVITVHYVQNISISRMTGKKRTAQHTYAKVLGHQYCLAFENFMRCNPKIQFPYISF